MCVVSEIIACDCCGEIINTADWNWEYCLNCGENLCKECMKIHICASKKEKKTDLKKSEGCAK